MRFDFGLLKSEMENLNSVSLSLMPDLLCVDSLLLFRALDEARDAELEILNAEAVAVWETVSHLVETVNSRENSIIDQIRPADPNNEETVHDNNTHQVATTGDPGSPGLGSRGEVLKAGSETPQRGNFSDEKVASLVKRQLFPEEAGDQGDSSISSGDCNLVKGQKLINVAHNYETLEGSAVSKVTPSTEIVSGAPTLRAQETVVIETDGEDCILVRRESGEPPSDATENHTVLCSQDTVITAKKDITDAQPQLTKKSTSTLWELTVSDSILAAVDMVNTDGENCEADGSTANAERSVAAEEGKRLSNCTTSLSPADANRDETVETTPKTEEKICDVDNHGDCISKPTDNTETCETVMESTASTHAEGSTCTSVPNNPNTSVQVSNAKGPKEPQSMTGDRNCTEETSVKTPVPQKRPFTSNTNHLTDIPSKRPKVSYRLPELHNRVVGYYPPGAHRAEDDSLALIRLFRKQGKEALHWADQHAIPFVDIAPMYSPKKKEPLPRGVFPDQ